MTEKLEESCENCRWWQATEDEPPSPEGWCRRHAPSPMIVPSVTSKGIVSDRPVWPLTFRYEWCGEFQPKSPCMAKSFPWDKVCNRVRNAVDTNFDPRPATYGELILLGRQSILGLRRVGIDSLRDLDDLMKSSGLLEKWLLS